MSRLVPLYTERQLILKNDEQYQMLEHDLNQINKETNQLCKQIGALKKQHVDVPEHLYARVNTLKTLRKDCEIQLDSREQNICSHIDQQDEKLIAKNHYLLGFFIGRHEQRSSESLYLQFGNMILPVNSTNNTIHLKCTSLNTHFVKNSIHNDDWLFISHQTFLFNSMMGQDDFSNFQNQFKGSIVCECQKSQLCIGLNYLYRLSCVDWMPVD